MRIGKTNRRRCGPGLFVFFAICLFVLPLSALQIRGMVLDPRKNPIPHARVTAVFLSARHSLGERIGYSGDWGEFAIPVPEAWQPLFDRIELAIAGNIYQQGEWLLGRREVVESQRSRPVFTLEYRDFSRVEWHSPEHLLLYVRPADQNQLHRLLLEGRFPKVDGYINTEIQPQTQGFAWAFAGLVFFDQGRFVAARACFDRSPVDLFPNLMGIRLLARREYGRAFESLQAGVLTRRRAEAFFDLAVGCEEQGNSELAAGAYRRALQDYSDLMRVLKFKWDDRFLIRRETCREKLEHQYSRTDSPSRGKGEELVAILKGAADYCQRLEEMGLYYFNQEKKTDHIFFSRHLHRAMQDPHRFFKEFQPLESLRIQSFENQFEFDLQLITEHEKKIVEKRKPLFQRMEEGLRMEVPNYTIEKAFYGPIGLIGREWQDAFNYSVRGKEILFNTDAVVLEAVPRILTRHNRLCGRLWVDAATGGILKIEWTPYGVANREDLRLRGMILYREPRLIFTTEYRMVREGIRFPSRCRVVESYVGAGGDIYTRINTEITYQDYRFFIIQMDTLKEELKKDA